MNPLLWLAYIIIVGGIIWWTIRARRRARRKLDKVPLDKTLDDAQMDADAQYAQALGQELADSVEEERKAAEILALPAPVAKVLITRAKKIKKKKHGKS